MIDRYTLMILGENLILNLKMGWEMGCFYGHKDNGGYKGSQKE